jgi:hypothetical protein
VGIGDSPAKAAAALGARAVVLNAAINYWADYHRAGVLIPNLRFRRHGLEHDGWRTMVLLVGVWRALAYEMFVGQRGLFFTPMLIFALSAWLWHSDNGDSAACAPSCQVPCFRRY